MFYVKGCQRVSRYGTIVAVSNATWVNGSDSTDTYV